MSNFLSILKTGDICFDSVSRYVGIFSRKALWIKALLVLLVFVLPFFRHLCLSSEQKWENSFLAESVESWPSFQSAYFTVYHEPDVNLKRVLNRLSTRGIPQEKNPPSYAFGGLEAKVAYRLDRIFSRAKEILGATPAGVHINIRIFKNRKGLNDKYCLLSRRSDSCKSFYVYRYNTIYTSEQDITDSLIAHEMAHALIDNYFSTTPPEEMAEILATNVDLHLDD